MTTRRGRRRQHRKHKRRRVRSRLKEAIERELARQRNWFMAPHGVPIPPEWLPMSAEEVLGWTGQ